MSPLDLALTSCARLRRLADDDRRCAIVDVPLVPRQARRGRRAYEPATSRARSSSTSTTIWPTRRVGARGRHPLPAPAAFAAPARGGGIGDEHLVVAYDDVGGWVAARLWWMLDDLGHRATSPCSTAGSVPGRPPACRCRPTAPRRPPAASTLARRWTNVIERDELPRAARRRSSLLDARAAAALSRRGRADRPGRRPHPDRAERADVRQPRSDGRSAAADELLPALPPMADGRARRHFCGSGTSACHNSLAMRMAGLPDPILYVGSFSDWSRTGMPVSTGAETDPVLTAQRRER